MSDRERLDRNLAARGYLLEVDPLRPRDTDEIIPAAEYVTGYDAGWRDAELLRPRLVQSTAFGCGVVVGMLLAFVLTYAAFATSRAATDPTSSLPVRDVSGPVAAAAGRPLPGAPRSPVVMPAAGMRRGSASGNPSAAAGAPSVTGPATWYDAPSIHDAAAGPALRKALGPHWRGSDVEVCRISKDLRVAAKCVTTTLTDWCACGHGRVVDLDDRSFARLAPLSVGVLRVTVTVVGQIDVPETYPVGPATDVQP